jgi:hypothetical protein
MAWRIQINGLEAEAWDDVFKVLRAILLDAGNITNFPQFCAAMDMIRKACGLSSHGVTRYQQVAGALSREALLAYYEWRAGDQGAELLPAPLVPSAKAPADPTPGDTVPLRQRDRSSSDKGAILDALFVCERLLSRCDRYETAAKCYDAVTRSTSWRLTEPVRRLADCLRVLRSLVSLHPFKR